MRVFENPDFLRMYRQGMKASEIGRAMGRAVSTIHNWALMAQDAGLVKPAFRWSQEMDDKLRDLYAKGVSIDEIAKALNKTPGGVIGRVNALRIARRSTRHWKDAEVETLKAMTMEGKTADQIAKALGRNRRQVEAARRRFGLSTGKRYPGTAWPAEDAEKLKNMWKAGHGAAHIASVLGYSESSIDAKARRLGLVRDRAYPVTRKPAQRSYAHLHTPEARKAALAARRENMGLTPMPKKKAKVVDVDFIPETARPWLSRKFGECAYPYGPRGNVHSCCQPTFEGGIYCESHSGLCYDYTRAKRAA